MLNIFYELTFKDGKGLSMITNNAWGAEIGAEDSQLIYKERNNGLEKQSPCLTT